MKKLLLVIIVGAICSFGIVALADKEKGDRSGEAMFKQHCTMCHPDGGNIINPQKTLRQKERAANNINSKADIIRTMRNPGPGMTKFDESTISNHDAEEIAEYILKTFK